VRSSEQLVEAFMNTKTLRHISVAAIMFGVAFAPFRRLLMVEIQTTAVWLLRLPA
jgi:hypothetical protein